MENIELEEIIKNIEKCNPIDILNILEKMPLFNQAVIICLLPPFKSSLLLQNLPEETQPEILKIIINGIQISDEQIWAIVEELYNHVKNKKQANLQSIGGIENAVQILKFVDRPVEKRLLQELKNCEPEISSAIKEHLFVFEDFLVLKDNTIKRILMDVGITELKGALKDCSKELVEKITKNMPEKTAQSLLKELQDSKDMNQHDIEQYQKLIISLVRKLNDNGDIYLDLPHKIL